MTLWHNAAFDLPALGVVSFEEDGHETEALISDPVLVYTADGRMLVAEYEEDEAFAFRGWVQTDPSTRSRASRTGRSSPARRRGRRRDPTHERGKGRAV